MKLSLYVVAGFVAVGLVSLLIAWRQVPVTNPVAVLALVVLFGGPALGGFWMMYMAIRHEKNPAPMILLALIPFTFLWYYFERFRSDKYKNRC